MCEAEHDPWCRAPGTEHDAAHEFCERHQILWCRLCEGRCPDCRTERLLGEPDDDDPDVDEDDA